MVITKVLWNALMLASARIHGLGSGHTEGTSQTSSTGIAGSTGAQAPPRICSSAVSACGKIPGDLHGISFTTTCVGNNSLPRDYFSSMLSRFFSSSVKYSDWQ